MSQELILGESLKLRPWRRYDVASLVKHANDAEVAYYTSHRFPHPYTELDAQKFLRARRKAAAGVSLAIDVDGEAAGGIAVTIGEGTEAHCAELGYWLGRQHWGKGVMSQVVARFVPWVMENRASCALLERIGFVCEARMRAAVFKHGRYADALLYSLVNVSTRSSMAEQA